VRHLPPKCCLFLPSARFACAARDPALADLQVTAAVPGENEKTQVGEGQPLDKR
jgi:hypothetical protein